MKMCVARRTLCPEGHTTYTVLEQCNSANIKLPHYDKKMCMRPGAIQILKNDTLGSPQHDSSVDEEQRRGAAYKQCSHWSCRKRFASSWVCEDVSQTRRSITVHLVRPSAALWAQQVSHWETVGEGSEWRR